MKILEPNSVCIKGAAWFIGRAKMKACMMDMYQNVRELSIDETNDLKRLGVWKEPSSEDDKS
ncbi:MULTISPECIES: hypothetical protein [Ehrlichia]|uniref:Uncharacterized protein n=1 Tax=Ehrlichia cf. muris str. EmCRT TaxID=1359167 RepID=A0A0F3NC49_9RICK|nr:MULTISPECIES: hypothetical protein [Ehrlichia]KJV65595.1 hypothetical protein EMUCRT_0540 [Ehrlichia cf. muris str. EmCRT]